MYRVLPGIVIDYIYSMVLVFNFSSDFICFIILFSYLPVLLRPCVVFVL